MTTGRINQVTTIRDEIHFLSRSPRRTHMGVFPPCMRAKLFQIRSCMYNTLVRLAPWTIAWQLVPQTN